jgi:GntR family transcriptional regulator
MKTLDRSVPVPLYYQIYQLLEERILSGEYKAGDYFSTELELQDQFDVSRATIRKALEQLEANRYITRITGKGIFIASMKLKIDLPDLLSFSEEMKKRGLKPGTKLLGVEMIEPPVQVREALGLEEGARTIIIRRIRYGDEMPIVYSESFVAAETGLALSDNYSTSLYELIHERTGTPVEQARHSIEAALAEEESGAWLGVEPGFPLLAFRRTAYDASGNPLVYEWGLARGDQYSYEITLRRSPK